MACTQQQRWGACALQYTKSPPWTCRRTNCSDTWTTWSSRIDSDESNGDGPQEPRTKRSRGRPACTRSTTRSRGSVHDGDEPDTRARRVVHPDGTRGLSGTALLSPPLGLGKGHPFEAVELRLPEDSRLVLYTDGLIENRDLDIDTGLDLLHGALEGGRGVLRRERVQAAIRCDAARTGPPKWHRAAGGAHQVARAVAGGALGGAAEGSGGGGPRYVTKCGAQLQAWGLGEQWVHRETHPQRADHQCDPISVTQTDQRAAAAPPQPDLRGVGRVQHLATCAEGSDNESRVDVGCSWLRSSPSGGARSTRRVAKSFGLNWHCTTLPLPQ